MPERLNRGKQVFTTVKPLTEFYKRKSVVKNNKFICLFEDLNFDSNYPDNDTLTYMPDIQPWHVKDVSFDPHIKFEVEQNFLSSIPKGNHLFNANREISITFEEDKDLTIQNFIRFLQQKIIDSRGLYRSQRLNRINIKVFHFNEFFRLIDQYHIEGAFFSGVDKGIEYVSGEGSVLEYKITFNTTLDKINRIEDNLDKHIQEIQEVSNIYMGYAPQPDRSRGRSRGR